MKFFGFRIERDSPNYIKKDKVNGDPVSFVDPDADSTAAIVFASPMSSASYIDVNGKFKTESQYINKYREMSGFPEVDNAISEIVNEAFDTSQDDVIKIDLTKVNMSESSKRIIKDNFDEVVKLLDFENRAYDIFKRWYVDGRLYYHAVVDKANLDQGIKELRYVDPRKIREVKEIELRQLPGTGGPNQASQIKRSKTEYYLYNDAGFGAVTQQVSGPMTSTSQGIRITKDSVIHVPSGISDVTGTVGLSNLHKAIRILNELKMIEDSLIIYRLARAPERRVWQVDVGSLPPRKAEEYLKKVADLQKNKLIYDSTTGQMRDDRKFMSMTEDFWLPKRADGVGTSVTMLQGGQNLGNIEDVVYFQKLLYNSLNVPVDRLQADTPFAGNTQEISRAELKFNTFISRLRKYFQSLFTQTLEKHLILKGLLSYEEFQAIKSDIRYIFAVNEHFTELIEQQIQSQRMQTFMLMEPVIGKYYSNKWVRRNIFRQTEDDMIAMNAEIMEESNDPLYAPPEQPVDDSGTGEDGVVDPNPGAPQPNHGSGSSTYYKKQHKVENAKGVVNALSSVKEKDPTQKKNYLSAVQILARNKKK